MSDNKLIAIFFIGVFVCSIVAIICDTPTTKREKAFQCIENSDKTDQDICNCLWKYEIVDTTLCKNK